MGILSRKNREKEIEEEVVRIDSGQTVFPEWSIGGPKPVEQPEEEQAFSQDDFTFENSIPVAPTPVSVEVSTPASADSTPVVSEPAVPVEPVVPPVVEKAKKIMDEDENFSVEFDPLNPDESLRPKSKPQVANTIQPTVIPKAQTLNFQPAKEPIQNNSQHVGTIVKPQPVTVTKATPVASQPIFGSSDSTLGQMAGGIEDQEETQSTLSLNEIHNNNEALAQEQFGMLGSKSISTYSSDSTDNMGEFLTAEAVQADETAEGALELEETIMQQGERAISVTENSVLTSEESVKQEEDRLKELLEQLNSLSDQVKQVAAASTTSSPVVKAVSAPEPVPEPVFESVVAPVPEPTPEPIVEPTPEPIVESVPEPIDEPVLEPIVESTLTIEPSIETSDDTFGDSDLTIEPMLTTEEISDSTEKAEADENQQKTESENAPKKRGGLRFVPIQHADKLKASQVKTPEPAAPSVTESKPRSTGAKRTYHRVVPK